MTRPPTAAQRRVIDAADPVTGRLRGTEAQLTALVRRGLAFRHPRPPHDHFLTPAGTVMVKGTSARVRAGTRTVGSAKTTGTPVPASRSVTGCPPGLVTDRVSWRTAPGAPSA